MILRKNILDSLLEFFKNDSAPTFIEIIGKAGVGKTTIIPQIPLYFKENGINTLLIKMTAQKDILPFEHILNSITEKNNYIPKSFIDFVPMDRSENLRYSQKLLSFLRKSSNDLILLIVDDFHVLSNEEQINFKLLVDSKFSNERIGLIPIGRPGWEGKDAISVLSFNKIEFNNFIINKINKNWVDQNELIMNWIFKLTKGHPFLSELYIEKIIYSSLSSKSPVSIEEVKNLNIPKDISKLIMFDLENEMIPIALTQIFNILSVSRGGVKPNNLIKLLHFDNSLLKKMIDIGIKKKYLKKSNNEIQLFHPMQKEIINAKLTLRQKDTIINSILNSKIKIIDEDKYFLIRNISNKTTSQIEELIQYVEVLYMDKKYYLEIEYLQSIKNYMLNPEVVIRLGAIWMKLNNIENAEKYFKIILENPIYNKNRFYLSEIIYFQIKTSQAKIAIENLKYCLDKESEIPERQRYFLYSASAWLAVRNYNWDEFEKIINHLKKNSLFSIIAKIDYYKSILMTPPIYPGEIKNVEYFKEAEEFAVSINRYDIASQYCNTIMAYYMQIDNKNKLIIYHQKIIDYSLKSFDLDVLRSADMVYLTFLQAHNKLFEAITLIKKYDNNNFVKFIKLNPNFSNVIIRVLFDLGKIKPILSLWEINKIEIIQHHKMFQISYYQTMAYIFFMLNRYTDAEYCIKNGIKIAEEINRKSRLNALKILSFSLPEKWNKLTKKEKEYNNQLISNYSNTEYLNYILFKTQLKNLNKTENVDFNNWISSSIVKNEFFKQIILIMDYFRLNKLTSAKTILSQLEINFDGKYLVYFYELYEFISQLKFLPKADLSRAIKLKEMIHYIIYQNDDINYKLPKHKVFRFERLIYSWTECMINKIDMNESEIELFTQNYEKIENIKTSLKLYDINIKSEYDNSNEIEISVSLFGNSQIWLLGKQIIGKGKLTKSPSKLLFFLLINQIHKTPILLNKLAKHLYPQLQSPKLILNRLNIQIRRINKQFNDLKSNLLTIKNNKVTINQSINFRLDSTQFDELKLKGENQFKENNWQGARLYFELCYHLYEGKFLYLHDGQWVEENRSYYLNNYLKVIYRLIIIYKNINQIYLIIPILKHAKSIHPYVEEIDELIDKYIL